MMPLADAARELGVAPVTLHRWGLSRRRALKISRHIP